MKEHEGQNKRQTPRLKKEVTVQYTIKTLPLEGAQLSVQPQHSDITRTKDLSENGVAFITSHDISPESILEINLRLPTQREQISLEGEVVSCEEIRKNVIYKIGVKFINFNDERRKSLRNFISLFL